MNTFKRLLILVTIIAGAFSFVSIAHAGGYKAHATSYYPDSSQMEGGFKDRIGKKLYTLQSYLNGKAPYVSVAMDSRAFAYGTKLQIPELDKYYGKQIEFRVVDTGGRFKGKGKSRIDICTSNYKSSINPMVNRTLTLVQLH